MHNVLRAFGLPTIVTAALSLGLGCNLYTELDPLTAANDVDGSTDSGSTADMGTGPDTDKTCDTAPLPAFSPSFEPSNTVSLAGPKCIIKDETLHCFGAENDAGQLGISPTLLGGCDTWGCINRIPHPEGKGWAKVATGNEHACALDVDGQMWCWGSNEWGQLGVLNAPRDGTLVRPSGLATVSAIAASGLGTCAIKADNRTANCWGADFSGQTGVLTGGVCDGAPGRKISEPTRVSVAAFDACPSISPGPTGPDAWRRLIGGFDNMCGQVEDGRVFCWGGGTEGITGTDVPLCVAGCIAADLGVWDYFGTFDRAFHVCGLRDGIATCWGGNGNGQLGTGRATEDRTPDVDSCDRAGDRSEEVLFSEAQRAIHPQGLNWKMITTGFLHTCALDEVDQVSCWGNNESGQSGDNDTMFVAQHLTANLIVLPRDSFAVEVFSGYNLSCALTSDTELYCWGADGQRCAGEANCPTVNRVNLP